MTEFYHIFIVEFYLIFLRKTVSLTVHFTKFDTFKSLQALYTNICKYIPKQNQIKQKKNKNNLINNNFYF